MPAHPPAKAARRSGSTKAKAASRTAKSGARAAKPSVAKPSAGAALAPGAMNSRPGEANGNAKVTAKTVRAWRREAAKVARERLRLTKGLNAKTGAPLASLLRGTGLFARFAREHVPPVTVPAVCMAVYGDTWADLPGALPRYTPREAPRGRAPKRRARRAA